MFLAVAMLSLLPALALAETSPTPEVTVTPEVTPSLDPSPTPTAEPSPETTPEVSPTPTAAPSGKDYRITYKGGNSFSTNNSAVPTSVEIDGSPVSFTGDGKSFTVSCVKADSERITVRWNSISISTNFRPSGNIYCSSITPPKTGDMSAAGLAIALFAAAAAAVADKKR